MSEVNFRRVVKERLPSQVDLVAIKLRRAPIARLPWPAPRPAAGRCHGDEPARARRP
jgi:hypothetical protein